MRQIGVVMAAGMLLAGCSSVFGGAQKEEQGKADTKQTEPTQPSSQTDAQQKPTQGEKASKGDFAASSVKNPRGLLDGTIPFEAKSSTGLAQAGAGKGDKLSDTKAQAGGGAGAGKTGAGEGGGTTGGKKQDNDATGNLIADVTVYIEGTEQWGVAERKNEKPAETDLSLDGMYVQIEVVGFPAADGGGGDGTVVVKRNYEDQKRNVLSRFFWGKDWSATLNFKLRVSTPDLDVTIPLANLGHESTSKSGEVFVTELTRSAVRTPYFRVTPLSKLSVTTEYRTSTTVSSTVVRTALNVAREATQLVAPGASILTTLSREGFRGQAQVFDTALNMMFAENITEREVSEFGLHYWQPGVVVKTRLQSPMDDSGPVYLIGDWWLRMSYPRPSIFSPIEICAKKEDGVFCEKDVGAARSAVTNSVKAAEILGYQIVSNTTIATYLAQQSWYAEGISGLAEKPATAGSFCNRIVRTLYDLGLNEFDARLSAKAVGELMPMDGKALKAIKDDTDSCAPSKDDEGKKKQ